MCSDYWNKSALGDLLKRENFKLNRLTGLKFHVRSDLGNSRNWKFCVLLNCCFCVFEAGVKFELDPEDDHLRT